MFIVEHGGDLALDVAIQAKGDDKANNYARALE